MSEVQRKQRILVCGAMTIGLLAGCESSSQTVATNPESSLRLSQKELTPTAGCQRSSNDPTHMSSYVVTLIDVTPDAEGKLDPKSALSGPPTTCTSATTFAVSAERGSLEVGNSYVALVDGYTESELSAVKRDQRPVQTNGSPATPRWQWLCSFGQLSEPVLQDLLDITQAIARLPAPTPDPSTGSPTAPSTVPDAALPVHDAALPNSTDVTSSHTENEAGSALDAGTVFQDASFDPTTAGDASVDAAARLLDASARTSAPDGNVESSPLDPSTVDPSTAAFLDAASETQWNVTLSDVGTANADAASLWEDSGPPFDASSASDGAASSPDENPRSALELLVEVSKEQTAPAPAKLVQSRLSTLRGCVALP